MNKLIILVVVVLLAKVNFGQEVAKEETQEKPVYPGACTEVTVLLNRMDDAIMRETSPYSEYYGLTWSILGVWNFGLRGDDVIEDALKYVLPALPALRTQLEVALDEVTSVKLDQRKLRYSPDAGLKKKADLSDWSELSKVLYLNSISKIDVLGNCDFMPVWGKSLLEVMYLAIRADSQGLNPPKDFEKVVRSVVNPVSKLVEEQKRMMRKMDDLVEEEDIDLNEVMAKSHFTRQVAGSGWGNGFGRNGLLVNPWSPTSHVGQDYFDRAGQYAPQWLVEFMSTTWCPGSRDLSIKSLIYSLQGCQFFQKCGGAFHELYRAACDSHTICYLCGNGTGQTPISQFNGGQWQARWTREECDDGFRARIDQLCRAKYGYTRWNQNQQWECLSAGQTMWEDMREEGRFYFAANAPYWCNTQCAVAIGEPEGEMVWPYQMVGNQPSIGFPSFTMNNLGSYAATPEFLSSNPAIKK